MDIGRSAILSRKPILGQKQNASLCISSTETPLKSAHDVLTLLVSWARGETPGVRAVGPAARIAATIHLEMVSRKAGEKGSLVITRNITEGD